MGENSAIKALVIVTDYPGEGRAEAHRFVHVRNKYYLSCGIDITVLNFAAEKDYTYEGIRVISSKTYKGNCFDYEILVSHQPNIRQHYAFMKKYGDRFKHFILFFHGHEVLRFSKVYPRPFPYVTQSKIKLLMQDVYDLFKLKIWHNYIPRIINKSSLIFVSKWMLDEFIKATKTDLSIIQGHYDITYNCVGRDFEINDFNYQTNKQFDFITIRSNIDGAKYCIDIVNNLAKNNPDARFLVVGKGRYFDYNEKAANLTWEDRSLNHTEIIQVLNTARCGLMPTRTDAQGLMMCEMATFGMPLITSDLPVCHEALDSFINVAMISNTELPSNLLEICERLESGEPFPKNKSYFNENTSAHEVKVIQNCISELNKE